MTTKLPSKIQLLIHRGYQFPDNYRPSSSPAKATVQDSVQYQKFDELCQKLYIWPISLYTFQYHTFKRTWFKSWIFYLWHWSAWWHFNLKSNMSSFDKLLDHDIKDVRGMNDTKIWSFRVAKISIICGALTGRNCLNQTYLFLLHPGVPFIQLLMMR